MSDYPVVIKPAIEWAWEVVTTYVTSTNDPHDQGSLMDAARVITAVSWAKYEVMTPKPDWSFLCRQLGPRLKKEKFFYDLAEELMNYPRSSEMLWVNNWINQYAAMFDQHKRGIHLAAAIFAYWGTLPPSAHEPQPGHQPTGNDQPDMVVEVDFRRRREGS